MFQKLGESAKRFDETKCILFLIKDGKLLEEYHDTWDKISDSINKKLGSKPVYNEKRLKTKIKSYSGKELPSKGYHCICLTVKLIDSVFKISKSYYPDAFLEKLNISSEK